MNLARRAARGGNNSSSAYQYRWLPVEELHFSKDNVRHQDVTADVDELAENMDRVGLLQPIVVRPRRGGGHEVLVGQRRLLAAQRLGWTDIPALVTPGDLDELEARALSFAENIQRRDLSRRDKMEVCVYLRDKLGGVREVAQWTGASETTIRKWLGLAAAAPPLRDLVEAGRISSGIASRIAQVAPSEEVAAQLAERIATERPTREMQERIADAAEELRGASADLIFQEAIDRRERKRISFSLPEKYQRALELASHDLRRDESEIAEEATVAWLEAHLYA